MPIQPVDDRRRAVVMGLGELLWDCFGDVRRPGGAPANVAFHADQLGARGVIVSRVGRDALGDDLLAFLKDRDLDIAGIQRDARHPTGTVTVETDAGGQPRYVIHENVAWDHLAFDVSLEAITARVSAVCFGTLAQRTAASRRAIEAVLDRCDRALRVFDVNIRPPWFDAAVIESSLRRSDVAKLNHEEVPIVADLLKMTLRDPRDVSAALVDRFGLQLVCITRGGAGCLAVSADERVDVPGRRIEVVDTVGSGDAFTAALVCGRLRGWPLARCAHRANAVGALVATRAGAMPNLRDEMAAVMTAG